MPADPLAIPPIPTADLAPASAREIAKSLAYALRFDARGDPVPGGWEFAANLAAEHLVEHLQRSGFVVLKARAAPTHLRGDAGPPGRLPIRKCAAISLSWTARRAAPRRC